MTNQVSARHTVYLSQRLRECLEEILHYPCTMVVAPTGFGKTVCMRDYLNTCLHSRSGLQLIWQNVFDEQPDHILDDIATAFGGLSSGFSDYLLQAGVPSDADSKRGLLRQLEQLETSLKGETVVVLDLCGAVPEESVRQLLEFVILHLPPALHLVILSRRTLLSWESKAFFYNRVNLIPWQKLYFSSEDVNQYYARCGCRLGMSESRYIARLCQGWGGWSGTACKSIWKTNSTSRNIRRNG